VNNNNNNNDNNNIIININDNIELGDNNYGEPFNDNENDFEWTNNDDFLNGNYQNNIDITTISSNSLDNPSLYSRSISTNDNKVIQKSIIALITTFLDPRFKDLDFLNNDKKNEVYDFVHNSILEFIEKNPNSNEVEKISGTSQKSTLSLFFDNNQTKGK